jgi:hypothetical protein
MPYGISTITAEPLEFVELVVDRLELEVDWLDWTDGLVRADELELAEVDKVVEDVVVSVEVVALIDVDVRLVRSE